MAPGWVRKFDEHIADSEFLHKNKAGAITGGVVGAVAGVAGGAAALAAAASAVAPVAAAATAELAALEVAVAAPAVAAGQVALAGSRVAMVNRAAQVGEKIGHAGAKAVAQQVTGAIFLGTALAGAYAGAAVQEGGRRIKRIIEES